MPFILGVGGRSASGKSTLCLYPHEKLGRVKQIVTEAVNSQLRVDPSHLGHVETVALAQAPGGRTHGADYYNGCVKVAKEVHDADTIIVNSISGLAKNRYLDELDSLKGVPTKFRTENETCQQLAVHFLKALHDANPNANLIAFYHLKELTKEIPNPGGAGMVRVLDTLWPETVGRKLDYALGVDFDAFLMTEKRAGPPKILEKGKPPTPTRQYRLHLESEMTSRFVFSRSLPGVYSGGPIDVTITEPGNYTPIHDAWNTLFSIL